MKHEHLSYTTALGWSAPLPLELDSPQTLVLIFGASEFIDMPKPILALTLAFPTSHIMGCSTAGEISGSVLLDHSLAVAVIRFEHTRLVTAAAKISKPQESFTVGRKLASALRGPELCSVLLLSDGGLVNGTELVQGFNLPPSVAITGGLAADGSHFQHTWVIDEGQPKAGMVTAIGFYGKQLNIGYGSEGGWCPTEQEWIVTRALDNVLYELNGLPALEVYKKAIGAQTADLPLKALYFPLALRAGMDDDRPIVRAIRSVDEARQSITFGGDVPEAFIAQLLYADVDQLINSAGYAARRIKLCPDAHDTLSLAISCVGRRAVLRKRAPEELQATLNALPAHTRQIGFYSYGEISPSGGFADLHNQTMTLTTYSEA